MLLESVVKDRFENVSPLTAASTVMSNSYAVDAVSPLSVFDVTSAKPNLAYHAS